MKDEDALAYVIGYLTKWREDALDNAALDYCGAQIADELDDLLRVVNEKSPAELQLDEGRGNHLDAGAVINTTTTAGVATDNGGDPG